MIYDGEAWEAKQRRERAQANFVLRIVCYALFAISCIAACGGW